MNPPISSLKFRGANLQAITDHHHELILAGPADTGKTVALCYKSAIIGMNVPKCHGALVRKTQSSIKDSVLKTWERVIANLPIRRVGGENPEKYVFPNGSELVLAGMDNADKLLSSEWDFIQVCQAEELKESDWEILASRVTGRGAVFKHPQIFGDCNPSGSKHWIRSRASVQMLVSTTKDNPQLYNDAGEITPEGQRRRDLNEKLYTGVRRKRLLEGIWATAEGAVYDTFDPAIHVRHRERSEMRGFKMALDDGYTNPAVILDIGEDSDGRWHIFRCFYKTGKLRQDVVAKAAGWQTDFRRDRVACDEAAPELIAQLVNAGVPAEGAKGKVLDGIRLVQDRLKVQGDGLPRLTIEPFQKNADGEYPEGSCADVQNEFESYVWKKDPKGNSKDEPEKQYDHSLDALRYLAILCQAPTGAWTSADVPHIMEPEPGEELDPIAITEDCPIDLS